MACYSPVTAYRSRSRNPSGLRGLVFNPSAGFVDLKVKLPCGGCIGCRLDAASDWQTRIVHEAKLHQENSFITLTYSDEKIPVGGTVSKDDCQKFMKRLRKALEPKQIRFFLVAEYGDHTQRPHYHAIIFGHAFLDDRKPHKKTKKGHQLYISKTLDDCWSLGNTYVGNLSPESAGYTARYAMKKITGEQAAEHYERIDPFTGELYLVSPEFALMSRRPGIGSDFYDRYNGEIFRSDKIIISGKEKPVPKYYSRKLKASNPERYEEIRLQRIKRAEAQAHNNTPDRLTVREEVKKSKVKLLVREL